MDAQAQDRAHRIGQTKEVHIYRMVCGSTVEENILSKAQQKRHLDFLVMNEGNFSAENLVEDSIFSASGLKDVLGIQGDQTNSTEKDAPQSIEAAMAAAEDEDDLSAMRTATKEAAMDNEEFDENAPQSIDEDGENEIVADNQQNIELAPTTAVVTSIDEDKELEAEFASWQEKVGPDFQAIESSLRPIEKYALRVHTDIEPFYSMFYLSEQQRLESIEFAAQGEEWDIDAIEREKEEEEHRLLAEGEYLSAEVSSRQTSRLKSWYMAERTKRSRRRRYRIVTGEGWSLVVDQLTGYPFWYNEDTGATSYSKPVIVQVQEDYQYALENGFRALPIPILVHIMSFLLPFPDRMRASETCLRWSIASRQDSLKKRVLSVELGARRSDGADASIRPCEFVSIDAALRAASPGDTIFLTNGHYWETSLSSSVPVQLISESGDPSRCIIELTGSIVVSGFNNNLSLHGLTIRRPKKIQNIFPCVYASHGSTVSISSCLLTNEGSLGAVVSIIDSKLQMYSSILKHGSFAGLTAVNSTARCAQSKIIENEGCGVLAFDSILGFEDCYFLRNKRQQITLYGKCGLLLSHCEVRANRDTRCLDFDPEVSIRSTACIGDDSFLSELREIPKRGRPSKRPLDILDDESEINKQKETDHDLDAAEDTADAVDSKVYEVEMNNTDIDRNYED